MIRYIVRQRPASHLTEDATYVHDFHKAKLFDSAVTAMDAARATAEAAGKSWPEVQHRFTVCKVAVAHDDPGDAKRWVLVSS